MNHFFDWLFSAYENTPTHLLVLELIAVFFGLLSVYFSKKNNIWVYPTGIVSTLIFVYILFKYQLLGDMMINAYYFSMSVYGWYLWSRKKGEQDLYPISYTTKKEHSISAILFLATIIFVVIVYQTFDKWQNWASYVDVLTTAIFFVGMWLMAKRKIENWIYWIVGDLISVPLYFYKGLNFAAIQYFVFTIIAIYGYKEWVSIYNKDRQKYSK